jgi:hypothetical protein
MNIQDMMPFAATQETMWTLSADRKTVRLVVPPLRLAGIREPIHAFMDFDAKTVDAMVERLADPSRPAVAPDLLAERGWTSLHYLKIDVDGADFDILQAFAGHFDRNFPAVRARGTASGWTPAKSNEGFSAQYARGQRGDRARSDIESNGKQCLS